MKKNKIAIKRKSAQTEKKPINLKKILLPIASVLMGLVVVIGIVFFSMRAIGRRRLLDNVTSQKPNFEVAENNDADRDGDASNDLDMNGKETYPELDFGGDLDPDSDLDALLDGNETDEDETLENEETSRSGDKELSDEEEESGSMDIGDTLDGVIAESAPDDTSSVQIVQNTGNDAAYDVIYNGSKYKYNQNIINILLLGVDKKGTVAPAANGIDGGQSDMLALVTFNPDRNTMRITTIPRDSIALIDIYNKDGSYKMSGYAQICLQHGYGDGLQLSNERAKNAVSRLLYGLPIHSCSSMNLSGIVPINDAAGGVTLTSLYTFNDFVKGNTYTLLGEQAYDYLHKRDITRHFTAPERLERQKQYMNAFLEQNIAKFRSNPSYIITLYNIAMQYIVTDLGASEMVDLAAMAATSSFEGIYSLQGTIDTSRTNERYYLDQNALKDYIMNTFYVKVE